MQLPVSLSQADIKFDELFRLISAYKLLVEAGYTELECSKQRSKDKLADRILHLAYQVCLKTMLQISNSSVLFRSAFKFSRVLCARRSCSFLLCIDPQSLAAEKNGQKVAVTLSLESVDVARQLLALGFTVGVKVKVRLSDFNLTCLPCLLFVITTPVA
jgi:hypothetical protein